MIYSAVTAVVSSDQFYCVPIDTNIGSFFNITVTAMKAPTEVGLPPGYRKLPHWEFERSHIGLPPTFYAGVHCLVFLLRLKSRVSQY